MKLKERWARLIDRWPTIEQIAEFEKWRAETPAITYESNRGGLGRVQNAQPAYYEALANPDAVVSIQVMMRQEIPEVVKAKCRLDTVKLEGPFGEEPIVLSKIRIRRLIVRSVKSLHLHDCKIGLLEIGDTKIVCRFTDTYLGSLDLVPEHVEMMSLDWHGGYLGGLQTHKNGIHGDIVLRGVQLPRVKSPSGAQWLRDARDLLTKKNNTAAAAYFHAGELVLTRPDERWPSRLVSHVYEIGSNFGISIGRPILWFFGVLVSIFLIALFTGTAANTEASQGWHGKLTSPFNLTAQILRAGIYAMQSIFNPLNLIVSKPLVVVQHWAAALICFALGLVGIVAFALFLLSVRRRFKLE